MELLATAACVVPFTSGVLRTNRMYDLCKMNGISYYAVSANNHYELADKIKKIFQEKKYISFQTVKKILRNAKGLFSNGKIQRNSDTT